MANSDFVNRLLAASRITDFYSANIAPHSFFYSEMLRSLVQARNENATDRESQQQAAVAYNSALPFPLNRRNRKRAWPHRFAELSSENVPLASVENDVKSSKTRNRDERAVYSDEKGCPSEPKSKSSLAVVSDKTPGNLHFPPTHSSAWYPPYPPFFIDLRVSGHIYDNNNETKAKSSPPLPTIGMDPKARQGSAFTVPQSSRNNSIAPMNLSTGPDSSLFPSEKRVLFKDRFAEDINHMHDEEDVKHRGYSKLRFESEEVIAVVDDADS